MSFNFDFITQDLAVGKRPTKDDIAALEAAGITCILNVGWPDEPEAIEVREAFCYLDLSILDDGKPKPKDWFLAGIEFWETRALHLDKVFVHCRHGINRSPAMAYALLRSDGMGPVEAEALVRRRRRQTGTGATGDWFNVYARSADEALS
jgi:protein tyrosine phosphatase (PTP) superfamily phosphohydrolase (DUF442 family)